MWKHEHYSHATYCAKNIMKDRYYVNKIFAEYLRIEWKLENLLILQLL